MNGPLLPLHLDFSGGGSHYGDPDSGDPTTHPLGVTQIDIDPRFKIVAKDVDPLAETVPLDGSAPSVECGMLGMEMSTERSYAMRLGLLWHELWGYPVDFDADSDMQWVLRHKLSDVFGNPPPYLIGVRTDANTWVLTSRTDSDPDPVNFASLERTGGGRGSKAEPKTFSTPVMPVQIVIRVNCGTVQEPLPCGALPVPGGE